MSVENLIKDMEAVHEQLRAEPSAQAKLELLLKRDAIMRELTQARHAEAAYHLKQVRELEEKNRAKTVQLPRTR